MLATTTATARTPVLEKTLAKSLRAAAAKLVRWADRLDAAAATGKGRAALDQTVLAGVEASFDDLPLQPLYEDGIVWTKPAASAARSLPKAAAPVEVPAAESEPAPAPLTRAALPADYAGVKKLTKPQVREAAALLGVSAGEGEPLSTTRKTVWAALKPPAPPAFVPAPPGEPALAHAAALAQSLGCPVELVLAALKKAKLTA